MASILKVDKIRGTALDSDSISIDGSGNLTTAKTLSAPGHVIQVINGPDNASRVATSSTSYTDTAVTATITPKFATSKILVRFNVVVGSVANVYIYLRLMRNIGGGSFSLVNANEDDTAIDGYPGSWTMIGHEALDSPATTSACTYKIQTKGGTTDTHYVGWTTDTDQKNMMNMTLMEIAQ
tara:strand:- start:1318 stop:1860 length:543 start_codon:yes stop_codon:yes gene_type:complete